MGIAALSFSATEKGCPECEVCPSIPEKDCPVCDVCPNVEFYMQLTHMTPAVNDNFMWESMFPTEHFHPVGAHTAQIAEATDCKYADPPLNCTKLDGESGDTNYPH